MLEDGKSEKGTRILLFCATLSLFICIIKMATIQKFEDLTVWQMGLALAIDVYKTLADCKDYGLRDQMQRSSVSIPSNIAEGFEREYNKEFIRF